MPLWKSMDKSTFSSTMQQSNTLWRIEDLTTPEQLERTFRTNIFSQFYLAWSVLNLSYNENQRFLILHACTTQTRDIWSANCRHKNDHQKLQKVCLRALEATPRKPDVEKLTGICSSLVEVICCCCYFRSFSDMHCHTWKKGVSS
jgi:hypothetical protein